MEEIALRHESAIPSSSQDSTKRARSPTTSQQTRDETGEDHDEAPELDELYVTMRTDVVGVQYYAGLVGRAEYVMLRREPQNPYDSNAVQVMNASGTQVGHIPRNVAARLAPLMDGKIIAVEGRMIGQNLDGSRHFKLAMDMSIYARPSHRPVLEPELVWATPQQRGFDYLRELQANGQGGSSTSAKGKGKQAGRTIGGTGDEQMKELLDGLKRVSEDEKQADGVMDALTADIDVTKLPLHPSPPGLADGILMVDLLPHQSQGLQWMISRENPILPATTSDAPVQFWIRHASDKKSPGNNDYWLNVATKTPQAATPVLGKGGIVADGMGLGKTLMTLSLILATKKDKAPDGFSQTTLVVCPLSVLSNWEKQIEDHVVPGNMTCYTYHGNNRDISATTLESYDIVLTTYQTVTADAPASATVNASPVKGKKAKTSSQTSARAGPLFKIKWKRVVADEGHVLKNPRAKMTQAFAALQAERRWVCTGTPIVNSPADLGSLLTCLQVCKPLDQADYFKSLLLRPLKNGDPAAGKLLQALVGQILLRRTKDSKDGSGGRLVSLPPIEYFQCPVKLDDASRQLYDDIHAESARQLQEGLRTGQTTLNILSMLTRMRQLCLSSDLIPRSYLEDLRRQSEQGNGVSAVPVVQMTEERRDELFRKLRQVLADGEECPVCFEAISDPRITDCGHAYCLACIAEVIRLSQKCPMDRHPIAMTSLLELPPEEAEWIEPDEEFPSSSSSVPSAKISELIRYLKVFDPSDKSLVFSQFTSFLDRVAVVLKTEGIRYCRFDGSMSAKKRQEVIASFQTPYSSNHPNTPVVMLISLKSGAVGLNLTAASNVFLCDPWWQSAIEAQAIDRVHRMGQKKPVRVFQLIAENTIESKVLEIQKRKDALVAKAFEKSGKESTQAKREARFEELKELLGVK